MSITKANPDPSDCRKAIQSGNFNNLSVCPILGQGTQTTPNTILIDGMAVSSNPAEALYRIVFIDRPKGSPVPVVSIVKNVTLTPGTPVPFEDSVTVELPADATQVIVAYVLATSQSSATNLMQAYDQKTYQDFISPTALQLATAAINVTFTAAQAQLKLLGIKAPAKVNSLLGDLNLANAGVQSAVGSKNGASVRGPGLPSKLKRNDQAHASAANQILTGISTTWIFDTAIPHDGTFSASLSLDYSATQFPDDPNFSEATMQMVSLDPSGTFHFYPTTVDTTNKVATATIDGLDNYYSLVNVGANGQTAVMLASAPTGYTLVNAGTATSNVTVTQYADNGTGTPTTVSLTSGAQRATTPGWLQAWAGSPSVAGASWFDNGSMFAVTPSSAPAGAFILTDVEYGVNLSTEIDLANNATLSANVGISLYGSNGTLVSSYNTVLDSKTSLSERVEGLFPSIPAGFVGYAVVASDQSLVASGYQFTNTTATGLAAQSLANSPAVLYAPQLGGSNIATTLHLVNIASTEANVTLRAWLSNGTPAAKNVQVQINAGAQYTAQIPAIFGIDPSTTGSLEVDSDTPGVYGDVLTMDASFFPSYAISLPLNESPVATSVLPYATAATTVYVLNPDVSAATVTVTPYDATGTAGAPSSMSVPAHGNTAIPVSASSYATISSTLPVVAAGWMVVPSGTTTGYLAIPAMVSSGTGGVIPINGGGTTLEFGDVAVGSSATGTLTITNTGASSQTVSAITASDPQFTIVSPARPFNISPGSQQAITIRFAPASTGEQSAQLAITATGTAYTPVLLIGIGTSAPRLSGPSLPVSVPLPRSPAARRSRSR